MGAKFKELGDLAQSMVEELRTTINNQMKVVNEDDATSQEDKEWIKEMFKKSQDISQSKNPSDHLNLVNELTQKFK